MPNNAPPRECLRCGRVGRTCGRKLCVPCRDFVSRRGELDDYPRETVALKEIVEEMHHPSRPRPRGPLGGVRESDYGRTFVAVALDLGVPSRKSAERQYYRAKRAGLLAAAA